MAAGKYTARKSLNQEMAAKQLEFYKSKHQTKKQPLSEAIKQQAALHAKYKEYSLKTEEELTEMYEHLGGGYREVCMAVIREKHFAKMEQDLEGEVK